MYIDSHAHIDFDKFDADRADVVQRATDASIKHIIQIALGPEKEKFERAYRIIETYQHYYMAAGLHPHDADHYTLDIRNLIQSYLRKDRVVALGEIGLDYYYDHSDREKQRQCFDELMNLAIEEDKPICIHTRNAFEDTLSLTQNQGIFSKTGGVIHCFTGNAHEAKLFLDAGAYISFSGVVTFPKALDVQEAAKYVPIDRMLIETDCPYLAPVPHRGKRNEPSYVVEVARMIAQLKGISIDEVAKKTTLNCINLFRL
ncbi:MAG: TatD family hydrolase [Bdellovibrionales bacterium]|nr:TatD family hydrolase [Bdellovibrionales bacterium]